MKAATPLTFTLNRITIISIHAAREGGDRDCNRFRKIYKISIHAAREGGDVDVRGTVFIGVDISIHAAREGGDLAQAINDLIVDISIHAAREGGDIMRTLVIIKFAIFQSTPPVKAATRPQPHNLRD